MRKRCKGCASCRPYLGKFRCMSASRMMQKGQGDRPPSESSIYVNLGQFACSSFIGTEEPTGKYMLRLEGEGGEKKG